MQTTITVADILQVLAVTLLAGSLVWCWIKYGLKD